MADAAFFAVVDAFLAVVAVAAFEVTDFFEVTDAVDFEVAAGGLAAGAFGGGLGAGLGAAFGAGAAAFGAGEAGAGDAGAGFDVTLFFGEIISRAPAARSHLLPVSFGTRISLATRALSALRKATLFMTPCSSLIFFTMAARLSPWVTATMEGTPRNASSIIFE